MGIDLKTLILIMQVIGALRSWRIQAMSTSNVNIWKANLDHYVFILALYIFIIFQIIKHCKQQNRTNPGALMEPNASCHHFLEIFSNANQNFTSWTKRQRYYDIPQIQESVRESFKTNLCDLKGATTCCTELLTAALNY